MKRIPKRRLIYSNFYGEMYTEDDAREYIFDNDFDEQFETKEDIADDDVWKEIAFMEELGWEDESSMLQDFFDNGEWILQGTFGLWWGSPRGGFTFDSFEEMAKAWNECDYIRLYDENGHFYIDAAHHDGTNQYEVKRLTDKGIDYLSNHQYDREEDIHDILFNSNFYSSLPHYAHNVFGCKEREYERK